MAEGSLEMDYDNLVGIWSDLLLLCLLLYMLQRKPKHTFFVEED